MWWSETIEKGNGRPGALNKTKTFRGGGYSDWRLPSINELKTFYVKSSKHKYKTIDFITLTTPYLISKDFGDAIQSADHSIKFFDFRDGRVVIKDSWNIVYIPSWKCSLLPVRGAN
jgi:hypothetical protein